MKKLSSQSLGWTVRLATALVFVLTLFASRTIHPALAQDEPALPSLNFEVSINQVFGWGSPIDVPVTLTLDDPATPQTPDYQDTQMPFPADWNPNDTQIIFNVGENIRGGVQVVVSNGTISRSFTIPNLTIVPLDYRINQVLGTADPGLQVTVEVRSIYQDLGYGQRHVISDASGNWVADFNLAGPGSYEGDVVDFLPGQAATAYIQMTTVDYLYYNAYAPAARIFALPAVNHVRARQWMIGSEVTLTVDDPGTPDSTRLYGNTDHFEWD